MMHAVRAAASGLRALGLGAMFVAVAASASLARDSDTRPEWQRRRAALDRVHRADEFRIYYTFDGPDALPDRADVNSNAVPDRIENIALQLVIARTIYTNSMKLRHPLHSPRYAGRARFIDVNVGALPFESGGKKQNGGAGDAIVNYRRPGDPGGGVSVLTIDIACGLPPENLTPAHELFHSFQYGYTLFKNGWFLEGMARWSESTLRAGAGRPGELPRSSKELEALFAASYEASGFWNAVASALDPNGRLDLPAGSLEARYVGGPTPVVADDLLRGVEVMRRVLEALDRADDAVSRREGLDPLDWKESRQKATENNPCIWSGVIEALRSYTNCPPPVSQMLNVLGSPGEKR